MATPHPTIEGLVGIAIDTIASHMALVYLEHAKVDHKRLSQCLRDLQALPALPPAWPDGAVRGLRARGDVSVDVEWAAGRLVRARLTAGARAVTMMVSGPHGALGTYDLAPGTKWAIDAGGQGTSW